MLHQRAAPRPDRGACRIGLYPALVVLGIYDRCTPKLASDASRAVAMLGSLAEAQAQLRSEGIALDIKTLRSIAYRYAARARAAQQSAACGLLDRVTGNPMAGRPATSRGVQIVAFPRKFAISGSSRVQKSHPRPLRRVSVRVSVRVS